MVLYTTVRFPMPTNYVDVKNTPSTVAIKEQHFISEERVNILKSYCLVSPIQHVGCQVEPL